MWSFLSKQLKLLNSNTADNKGTHNKKNAETSSRKSPLQFEELINLMGDLSDLSNNDVAFKFWIPEPIEKALFEISSRASVSNSEFLRSFLVIHCYGLYAFNAILDSNPTAFKWDCDDIMFSKTALGGKRIDTYWVAELGKNIAPIKVWIPSRLRRDLEILAKHVNLTTSNYVREILISRLFGHGMLPKRPEMFEAFPTVDAENWCADRDVEWREVGADEFYNYKNEAREIRTTYLEDEDT